MLAFLVRRVIGGIVILAIISLITFLLFFAVPGAEVAALSCGKVCTPEPRGLLQRGLGRDKPVIVQSLFSMGVISAGRQIGDTSCSAPCLGYSFANRQPVLETVMNRLPVTLSL